MSVPAAPSDRVTAFYGRSYPRASIVLDETGAVDHKRKNPPPSAVAPLLDWASKAAWNKGGAHIPGADPQPPKKPFTPLYAFLASKQAALKALHPHLRPADLLALAKADAAEQWDKLSDEEHQLYVSMADEDAERYERELRAFEQQHPEAAKKRRQRGGKPAQPAKPKAPLTAWRAFVLARLQQQLEAQPELREVGSLQVQIEVMKEAAPVWKAMGAEEKQPFVDKAAEDKARWEAELDSFPEYKAALAAKAAAKAAEKQQAAAKRTVLAAAKVQGRRKQPARPARALGPKAAAGSKAKRAAGAQRQSKRRKVQREPVVDDESESEAASESDSDAESEPQMSASDSDADISSDEEPAAADAAIAAIAEAAEAVAEEEDAEPESDEEAPEAEQSEAEEAEEEPSEELDAFVAATPAMAALPGDEEDSEAEAEAEELRGAEKPADLQGSQGGSQEQGLLGRVATFMMSGLKAFNRSRLSQGASPAAGDQAGSEALLGARFVKTVKGKPHAGKVERYVAERDCYKVTYEDGKAGELAAEELRALLAAGQPQEAPAASGEAKKRQGRKRRR